MSKIFYLIPVVVFSLVSLIITSGNNNRIKVEHKMNKLNSHTNQKKNLVFQ